MFSLTPGSAHAVSVVRERELDYKKAMKKAGFPHAPIHRIALEAPDRLQALRNYLLSASRPKAVFCWSDLDALQLLHQASELGLRVPEDLAIIGYDNSPTAGLNQIGLASMDQNSMTLGKLAGETLLTRIGGRRAPVKLLVEPQFANRRSASSPEG